MMKNVFQLHSSSGLYGAESVIFNICKAIPSYGYNPIIGTIETDENNLSEFAKVAAKKDLEISIFTTKNKFSPGVILKLLRLVKEKQIKLIHTHYSKATIQGFFASKIARIPLIETNHLFPPMPLSDRKLQRHAKIGAFFLRYADKTIAVSHKIKQSLIDCKVPENKINVIENGIDIGACLAMKSNARLSARKELGIRQDQFVIGGVGRLTEQKGFEYLIKAGVQVCSKHPNIRFIIAGDGPLKEQFNKSIGQLKLEDSFYLLGFRKDILRIISAMDIFVMPSIDEGLPMAMLEAMAIGVPVIVTAVGEIPRVIKSDENGILIKPKDSKELAEKIIFLIENETKREKMTDTALKTVRSKYSNDQMSKSYAHTYDCLLG
jgi:glycosyltransferase involved in cell wall biosynthesis